MNAMPNPSAQAIVAELHAEVKRRSTVPKVAAMIGMNYYSLRDNLRGESEMRLSTVYAVLDALGMSWEDLMQRVRLTQEQSDDERS